jgi:hypothetical protein
MRRTTDDGSQESAKHDRASSNAARNFFDGS